MNEGIAHLKDWENERRDGVSLKVWDNDGTSKGIKAWKEGWRGVHIWYRPATLWPVVCLSPDLGKMSFCLTSSTTSNILWRLQCFSLASASYHQTSGTAFPPSPFKLVTSRSALPPSAYHLESSKSALTFSAGTLQTNGTALPPSADYLETSWSVLTPSAATRQTNGTALPPSAYYLEARFPNYVML